MFIRLLTETLESDRRIRAARPCAQFSISSDWGPAKFARAWAPGDG